MIEYRFYQQEGKDLLGLFRENIKTVNVKPVREWLESHAHYIKEERTCRNFGMEDGTNGENYEFACSSCGFMSDVTDPMYCPRCGSRVVGE